VGQKKVNRFQPKQKGGGGELGKREHQLPGENPTTPKQNNKENNLKKPPNNIQT